ncbi:MAG: DNA gyrase/topoisomerase IV subunit A, partial [Vicingaceae bacterium]
KQRSEAVETLNSTLEKEYRRLQKIASGKLKSTIAQENNAALKNYLDNLIEYAINYFKRLLKDYGAGRERKTELKIFDDIEATKVVIRNTKLYVNKEEGFVGTALKKDEYVTDCSDIDDIIVFTEDGKMMVTKVDTKTFVGKNIIHVAVFKKKDKRTIYNMIYRDGAKGASYVKRFAVTGTIRDNEYDMTQGNKGSKVLYFTANPNGEAELVQVLLRQTGSIKKLKFDLDFADIIIKGRNSKGNIVSKYPIKRVELKEKGLSTLKPRKIWFDDTVQRLNLDARGEYLGEFRKDDRLLIINQSGKLKTVIPDVTLRFDDGMILIEKWRPKKPISAIYWEGEKELFYVKRFLVENEDKEEIFITEHPKSYLEIISTDYKPVVELEFYKPRGKDPKENQIVNLEEFIAIKGINAQGNQLTKEKVKQINLLEPLPFDEPEELPAEEIEVVDEENVKNNTETTDKNNDSKDDEDKRDENGQIILNLD